MTKSDLRTGMVLTFRNGRRAMVFKDACVNHECVDSVVYEDGGFDDLSCVKTDLRWNGFQGSGQDIVAVSKFTTPFYLTRFDSSAKDSYHEKNDYLEVIWRRIEPKKVTYEEVRKALGYDFEIVE